MSNERPATGQLSSRDERKAVDRISSFSDAVFAVAITLLVLNLNIPGKLAEVDIPGELLSLGEEFFAFALSFAIIGLFWVAHHSIFHYIERHDGGLLWLNLLFLMCIVFVPFSTSLISKYSDSRVVVIFYAASMAVTALAFCLLWWYASSGGRLVGDDLDPLVREHILFAYLVVAAVFLVSIGVAFINVTAATYCWWLILVCEAVLEFRRRRKAGIRAERHPG